MITFTRDGKVIETQEEAVRRSRHSEVRGTRISVDHKETTRGKGRAVHAHLA